MVNEDIRVEYTNYALSNESVSFTWHRICSLYGGDCGVFILDNAVAFEDNARHSPGENADLLPLDYEYFFMQRGW